jgi:hypothetical protein
MKSHYLIIPFRIGELFQAGYSPKNLLPLTENWVTAHGDAWKAVPENYKREGPIFLTAPSITSLVVPSDDASQVKEIKVIYYGHTTTYDFEKLEDGARIYIFAHGDAKHGLINTGGENAIGITPYKLNERLFEIMPSTQRNLKFIFRLFACESPPDRTNAVVGD